MNGIIEELNKNLELIILPTEQCDCRCIYCIQKFKVQKMSPQTVEGIKRLIENRISELDRFVVQWFGGEPLLASDIIIDVMQHIQNLKNSINSNLNIIGMMTTNATHLKSKLLNTLTVLGVNNYQITLDGDKEHHDKLRVKANGTGTFDLIWGNIFAAHTTKYNFNIMMRLHVNKDNSDSMRRLLLRTKSEIGSDTRFSIYIRPLSKYGGPNDSKLPICDDNTSMLELRSFASKLGLNVVKFNPYDSAQEYVCYAAKPYSYVIRSNSWITKCTVALDADYNKIGILNPDGTMQLDNLKISEWSKGILNGDKDALACPSRIIREEQAKLLRMNGSNRIPLKVLD